MSIEVIFNQFNGIYCQFHGKDHKELKQILIDLKIDINNVGIISCDSYGKNSDKIPLLFYYGYIVNNTELRLNIPISDSSFDIFICNSQKISEFSDMNIEHIDNIRSTRSKFVEFNKDQKNSDCNIEIIDIGLFNVLTTGYMLLK